MTTGIVRGLADGVTAIACCLLRHAARAAVPALFTITAAAETSAPLTGTLFLTQAERANLGKPKAAPASPAIVQPEKPGEIAAPIAPKRSVINGFVSRSDGLATVWVDGREKTGLNEALLAQITPESVGGSEGTLRVRVGDEKPSAAAEQKSIKRETKLKRRPLIKSPISLSLPRPKKLTR